MNASLARITCTDWCCRSVPAARKPRKPAPIEPELMQFIDDCIVPLLIRKALAKLSVEPQQHTALHSRDDDSV